LRGYGIPDLITFAWSSQQNQTPALSLHVAERNGWTQFVSMQPQYNLLYREEEREMLPFCEDQGVGVIPWSPMARGRLTRDWNETSKRTENDAFALKMFQRAAELDQEVVKVVARIAGGHGVPRAHVALAWLLAKPVITVLRRAATVGGSLHAPLACGEVIFHDSLKLVWVKEVMTGSQSSSKDHSKGKGTELQSALAEATQTDKRTAGVFLDTLSALAYEESNLTTLGSPTAGGEM
jgi:hypothetical protein